MFRNVSLTGLGLTTLLLVVGAYFTFTAVQGNYGLFQRIQIEAEAERLETATRRAARRRKSGWRS
jgi:cell division protein FtsB